MLAEKLPADTAKEWGLVNRVSDEDALADDAMAMAKRLAGGPSSLGLIRRMYWDGLENNYADQLQLEADLQKQAGQSSDYEEGVTAFREKRSANFTGK